MATIPQARHRQTQVYNEKEKQQSRVCRELVAKKSEQLRLAVETQKLLQREVAVLRSRARKSELMKTGHGQQSQEMGKQTPEQKIQPRAPPVPRALPAISRRRGKIKRWLKGPPNANGSAYGFIR